MIYFFFEVSQFGLCHLGRLTSLFHAITMLCGLNVFRLVALTETWNQFAIYYTLTDDHKHKFPFAKVLSIAINYHITVLID